MNSGDAAKRLVKRFGTECKIVKTVKGTYNPTLGKHEVVSEEERKGIIVVLSNTLNKSSKFDLDLDVNIDEGEIVVIIDIDKGIDIAESIIHNGKTYDIIKHREIEQKGVILLHKLVIREVK